MKFHYLGQSLSFFHLHVAKLQMSLFQFTSTPPIVVITIDFLIQILIIQLLQMKNYQIPQASQVVLSLFSVLYYSIKIIQVSPFGFPIIHQKEPQISFLKIFALHSILVSWFNCQLSSFLFSKKNSLIIKTIDHTHLEISQLCLLTFILLLRMMKRVHHQMVYSCLNY